MITNKALLQQAICDGVFNTPPTPMGMIGIGRPVTPAVLAAVSAMSDVQVLGVLTTYVAKKTAQLNAAVSKASLESSAVSTALAAFQTLSATVA